MFVRRFAKPVIAAAAALIVFGGLLAAPRFIDWTEYRSVFASRLSAMTGRAVSIDGDVDFVLFPQPAFNANEVRIDGASADDYIAIKRLSARLAFAPLFEGEFAFRELVLIHPEAHVTRDPDGGIDFLTFGPSQNSAGSRGALPSTAIPIDLDVERVLVDGGVAVVQDSDQGAKLTIAGIDVAVTARRATPISVTGDLVAANIPMTLDATIGRTGSGGVNSISLIAKLAETDATAKFLGTIAFSREWDLRGDLSIVSPNAAAALAAIGAVEAAWPMPKAAQGPLTLSAKVHGSRAVVTVDPLALDVGGTPAKGTINWHAAAGDGSSPPTMDLKIEVGTVPLEAWRFSEADLGYSNPRSPSDPFHIVNTAHAQASAAAKIDTGIAASFKKTDVKFNMRIPVLSYRGQILRGGQIAAAMLGGVLTISDASIELPAVTHVKAFGLVRLEENRAFEGALEMQTGDLRGVLVWLGVDLDPERKLPGRLSNASFRAAVQGTPTRIALDDVNATVDTSAVTGRISWSNAGGVGQSNSGARPTSTARPLLGIDLAVNALNVDAYLPLFTGRQSDPATTPGGVEPSKPATYGVTPVFADFAGLADFDAELRLQIGAVTAGGVANGKVGLDLGLKDATLDVRTASFENVGGATAWFSGSIGGFGITPHIDKLQFDLSTVDVARVGRAFGLDVPTPFKSLSPVSFTGVVKGSLAQADMIATLKAANLVIRADGQALTIDQQPRLSMNVNATQPSYAGLLKTAGFSWPLNIPDPGAIKFAARVTHENSGTKIESIDLHVGDNAVSGNLAVTREKGRTQITGTLSGIALAGDKLWPPQSSARQILEAPQRTAAKDGARRAGEWSEESIDWGFLKGWSGSIQLAGSSLSLRGIQLQDFTCRVVVADDALEIADWKGKVFGAPGQIFVRAAASPQPSLQGEIAFIGGDLGAIGAALNGGASGLKSGGRADFAGSFRAEGANAAALVAGLSGSGTVKITTSDAGSGAISGLLSAVTAANQLEESAPGSQGARPITLESRVSAAGGRIKIEDATVASKSYGGAFTGTIDLPRWQVDLAGRLRLESRTPGDAARAAVVPITIKGALDHPNILLLPAQ